MPFKAKIKETVKGTGRTLKAFLPQSRSHSRDRSINKGEQGPSRSPTPSPSTLGRKSDAAELFTLNDAEASESTLPAFFQPDSEAEFDDDVPPISVEEAPPPPKTTVSSTVPTKHQGHADL